jgi:hypothetical protein
MWHRNGPEPKLFKMVNGPECLEEPWLRWLRESKMADFSLAAFDILPPHLECGVRSK